MGRSKQTPEEAEKSRQKRRAYKTNHQKARRANQRLASAPTPKGRNKERVSVEAIQAEIAVNGAKPVSARFIREHLTKGDRARQSAAATRTVVEEGVLLVGSSYSPNTPGSRLEGNVARRVASEIKNGVVSAPHTQTQLDHIVNTQLSQLALKKRRAAKEEEEEE